jgi:hypothetical protein
MQQVILYISPQIVGSNTEANFVRVDLMEEELITLTQVIQDVQDIEKLFTDYSKTFNLPASKTNNNIFKYWFNPDVNNFNNQIFSTARIELNHFEFKSGKIQLNEVVMKDNKPSMYKVTFFGETVDFKNSINEDQLSDLAWLSNFDFLEASGGTDNVKEGLTNGLNFTVDGVTYNDAIIYPLITHTGSYIYSINAADFTNPYNINPSGANNTNRGVLKEDLKPAITIRLILKAIEQQYGITFKTGDFFDSSALNNLYLWLHREKGKIPLNGYWSSYGGYTRTAGDAQLENSGNKYGFFEPLSGIFHWRSYPDSPFSPAYEDNTTITITITPAATYASVLYDANIVNTNNWTSLKSVSQVSGTQTITLLINKDGSNGGMQISNVSTNPAKIITTLNANQPIQFTYSIKIDRYVKYSEFLNLNWNPIVINLTATFEPTNATQTPTQGDVVIIDQLPKLKVKDFLNGLFRQFNLTVFLNSQKEIVVKTLDNFYAGGETQDLTEYVKTDTHTVGDSLPFSEVDFEYSDPKTILAQQFQQINNQKYGELNYRLNVSKKNIYQIKLPFSQMLFERLIKIGLGNIATQVQVGTSINQDLQPSIGAPLIFYGIRIVNADNINYVSGNTRPEDGGLAPSGTRSSLGTWHIPSVCSEVGSFFDPPPTHNLNFGSEINTYTLTDYGGNNNSLFQTYYQNYITRVFNTRTRLFKFEAVLPLKVLLTLTLDDLIIIGTRTYTINKMTTKLQSGETSFELLNEPT